MKEDLTHWLTECIAHANRQKLRFFEDGDAEMEIMNLGKILAFEDVLRYLEAQT